MQKFTALEARSRFGQFLDCAQRGPVQVMRRGRVVAVMVSAEEYEAMRVFYAHRLLSTLNETAASAARAGLTPEVLPSLLNDED